MRFTWILFDVRGSIRRGRAGNGRPFPRSWPARAACWTDIWTWAIAKSSWRPGVIRRYTGAVDIAYAEINEVEYSREFRCYGWVQAPSLREE